MLRISMYLSNFVSVCIYTSLGITNISDVQSLMTFPAEPTLACVCIETHIHMYKRQKKRQIKRERKRKKSISVVIYCPNLVNLSSSTTLKNV